MPGGEPAALVILKITHCPSSQFVLRLGAAIHLQIECVLKCAVGGLLMDANMAVRSNDHVATTGRSLIANRTTRIELKQQRPRAEFDKAKTWGTIDFGCQGCLDRNDF